METNGCRLIIVKDIRKVYRWRGRVFVVKMKIPRLANYSDGKYVHYFGVSRSK